MISQLFTEVSEAVVAGPGPVGQEGAMDRLVHLSFGDFPGREYPQQLLAEHLIHGRDLARAIGADERMDDELVESCTSWLDAVENAYRDAGTIAARTPVSSDADAQCSTTWTWRTTG
jgi:hypothetical protein